ncbi:MAG TPA: RNA polymerase sigma factor [Polyangiaceae bacterium]|jgi:RNA polymerase sigma-70 factor (ECF subfamily)
MASISLHEVAPDDRALLAQAVDGNERAFALLYRRHARYVAGVAYRVMGSDAELDDVVQEVFLDASGALASVREADGLRGWLARITVRRVYKRLARRRRWRWLQRDQQELAVTVSDPALKTRVTDLYRTLERLAPNIRIPWVLHAIEGETLPDVARMCDISLATAKRRIAKAAAHVEWTLDEKR